MTLPRRPYQTEAIAKLKANPDRRQVFAHVPGAGKTRTAIEGALELGARRILVVAPALVRPSWGREFAKWSDKTPGLVTTGRKRTTLSEAEKAARDLSYAADIQVVSYSLVAQTAVTGWDFIVVDEGHRLRDPLSVQSKAVRQRFLHNPEAGAALLSGTLIPNEVRQIWNPVDTLFPQWAGKAQRTGKEPWGFLSKFCNTQRTEYGVLHSGFKKERAPELLEMLAPYVHEVGEADVAPYLPPLFVEPLYTDDGSRVSIAREWVETVDVTHFGIFTYLNETRRALVEEFSQTHKIFEVTAEMRTDVRDAILQEAAAAPRALVISTTGALLEGISLSFLKHALVVEWHTAMSEVLQFIGRFARQDSANTMPTYVRFVVLPDDHRRAEKLKQRIDFRNALLKSGRNEAAAGSVFKPREYSEQELEDMFVTAIGSYREGMESWDGEEEL
jgi:hypothetical protein